ncbi:MAG: hypothetical protein ABH830_00725 [Patescibacteria group bacterium]
MGWFGLSILCMFTAAIMNFLITSQTRNGVSVPFAMAIIATVWLPSFIFMTNKVGIFIGKTDQVNMTKTVLILILAGILSVVVNWLLYSSATKAPNPGLTFAIVGCQAGLVALLSNKFFGTSISLTNMLGMCLCILGLFLIKA